MVVTNAIASSQSNVKPKGRLRGHDLDIWHNVLVTLVVPGARLAVMLDSRHFRFPVPILPDRHHGLLAGMAIWLSYVFRFGKEVQVSLLLFCVLNPMFAVSLVDNIKEGAMGLVCKSCIPTL